MQDRDRFFSSFQFGSSGEHQYSRRALLARGGVLALGVPIVSSLLAACGGDDDDADEDASTATPDDSASGSDEPTATTAGASSTEDDEDDQEASPTEASDSDTPGEPQTLVIGFQYDAASLDPAVINGPIESDVSYKIYSSLLRLQSGTTSDFVPDIADSWEISDDGLVYTFELKQGVQWHKDYGDFTAEDVKFSFERLKDESTGSRYISQANSIEQIVAADDHTVEIHLVAPWPNFFLEFLQYRPGFIVNQRAIEEHGESYSENAVGTGAYMLDTFTTRDGVTLTRNEDYYGEPPFFDTLRYEMILEESVLGIALENGEVDIMYALDPIVALSLLENESISTERFASQRTYYMALNTERPPTDDVRVRQALWWAIDKDLLVEAAFEGLGVPLDTLLHPSIPESTWEERPYSYDPERAVQLLEEAGFDFDSTLLMPTQSGDPIPPVIQAQLAEIGVKTDTPSLERLEHFDALSRGEFNMGVSARLRFTGDQYYTEMLTAVNIPDVNWARYDNPELEELLVTARHELDDETRLEIWRQLQEIIHEDAPYIPLFAPEWVLATQPDIENAVPGPLRIYAQEISRTTDG